MTKYHGNFLKLCLKIPLSPYTMLRTHNITWRKFCSLFLNIVRRGKGLETRNCQNSSFSTIFVTVWKNLKNLSIAFYRWLFWITLKASNYPLHHYDINLNNFWSPNKQLKYLGRWGKIFFFQIFSNKTNLLALQRRFHRTRHCTWDCCIRNINAQFV